MNKSQKKMLRTVEYGLRNPVFTHGQLSVALSRATNVANLTVVLLERAAGKISKFVSGGPGAYVREFRVGGIYSRTLGGRGRC